MSVAIPAKYKVRAERHVRIPMRDGIRLSVDVIRPDAEGRFPVLIEYHPYRKDDASRAGCGPHRYLAERGFIGVRLDVRGTGGSEGVSADEYTRQEQEDGFDAVEWLAVQPWSNGNVGMWGSSYGGFTSIQVAMNRPPHLKAIAPMYASDDRYADDCHYTPGGNMRMYYDVGVYGGRMVAMNALPPPLDHAGEQWAEIWQQRLERNQPYLLHWIQHQVEDPYWRGGSLRPDYGRIQCPVYLIGGWRDGYASAMWRMFEELKPPKKLLMGPWVHARPDASTPGPRIDYLNEMARFFAHYLRGEDTGFMKEPAAVVYMQEYAKPDRTLNSIPGRWRIEPDFPLRNSGECVFYLEEGGRLDEKPDKEPQRSYDEYEYIPTIGLSNGYWSAGGMSCYLPEDQRTDEAFSLTFTSDPLQQDVQILGWPRVILHASSTARVASFVAKLSDVGPDGPSALIVAGSLNGTRRASLAEPEPMNPGEICELNIPMPPTGWIVRAGHRLRLAVSSSDFPNLWPTPEEARIRVYRGGRCLSRLTLPVAGEAPLASPEFLPAPDPLRITEVYAEPPLQEVTVNQISGAVTVANRLAETFMLEDGLGSLYRSSSFRCTANSRKPAQASVVGTHACVLKHDGDEIEVVAESSIRATKTAFHLLIHLNVTRSGRLLFQRRWMRSEPRRLL